jgi:hypothetical protein
MIKRDKEIGGLVAINQDTLNAAASRSNARQTKS